jgi:uncharacterized protein YlxW (UPF0749 family)
MSWEKIIGPATVVYIVSATIGAIIWGSTLGADVATLKQSTVNGERIARLEQRVDTLNENTRELKSSINELVRELKRQP